MAGFGKGFKGILIKSMEVVGNTANNIANNTKYKLDEMTIINRRREILSDFGAKAYEIWQKGVSFPDVLEDDLQELCQLDIRLNELRMAKLSNVETNNTNDKDETVSTESSVTGSVPASDAINALFENAEKLSYEAGMFTDLGDMPVLSEDGIDPENNPESDDGE